MFWIGSLAISLMLISFIRRARRSCASNTLISAVGQSCPSAAAVAVNRLAAAARNSAMMAVSVICNIRLFCEPTRPWEAMFPFGGNSSWRFPVLAIRNSGDRHAHRPLAFRCPALCHHFTIPSWGDVGVSRVVNGALLFLALHAGFVGIVLAIYAL